MEKNDNWLVSVMVSPINFLDEGVEEVISTLKNQAGADTLLVTAHGYNPELIERVEYDTGHGKSGPHGHPGGTFVATHPEYYRGISLGDTRATGEPFGDFDVLKAVIPEARAQGMRVELFHLEAASTGGRELNVPGFPRVLEVDIDGRRAALPCVNHPDYRAWQLALLEDIYKSYDIDGFTWGMERWGPLHQVLLGDKPACFCDHCQRVMRDQGMDPAHVLEGYRTLWSSVQKWRAEEGRESSIIDLIRILLKRPEILGWERAWTEQYMSMHRELYGTAKWLSPNRSFGLCLWHPYFINPLLRAEWDLTEIAKSADSISAFLLNFPEAARIEQFLSALTAGPIRGFEQSSLYNAFAEILGFDLGSYEEAVTKGLSAGLPPAFVGQGVQTIRQLVGPSMPVYPLIGIDVVQEGMQGVMDEAHVFEAIKSALDGGADGLHIARNYAEMRTSNVNAVGDSLRRLGRV